MANRYHSHDSICPVKLLHSTVEGKIPDLAVACNTPNDWGGIFTIFLFFLINNNLQFAISTKNKEVLAH